ncbi:flagellar hook-associated protein FlgL [Sphaerobacter thermophilus]|uniref:Flagellar hook-associated protein 3 n=1 Tax=Sphaerobacter thermophilus (strain ATCC 49802 / DSM 20745 / KCCM 41009 / NCIMB 13125 / S 6022) TaxID=479434 RepID=D1C182_SPHTD|nr:flagellar hook-associated protein FlgL [Sphaerobacter thermophilus]ACZ37999.1 flagellar hook-associated protein 3 [Sphaerobacter thermophilus DSM 20745]PZN67396.1 MAG: flagellar hook-associated protein 3 [Sphaerobacter thermophilus]
MRVSTAMMSETILWNITRNAARLDRVADQIGSGRQIRRPSDDPVGTANVLQLDSTRARIQQHLRNIDDARSWIDATDQALSSINAGIQRAREITLAAANGTLAPENRDAIETELQRILELAIGTANTRLNGRYIFSGQKTDTPAFSGPPNAPVYQGDSGPIVRVIDVGVTVTINVTGDTAILPTLNALAQAQAAVAANDPDAMRAAIDALDDAHTALLTAQARAGAIGSQLEEQASRLEALDVSVARLRSQIQDVDLAKAVSDYSTLQTIYQASLAAGSRGILPSLFDYLA